MIVNNTLYVSASRTTTQTSADQSAVADTILARGIHVILDMTTVGSGNVTLTIDGKDPASGKYYNLLTGAAVSSNGTTVYRIYPGLTAVANATVSDALPSVFRVVITANNANAATYSVGYNLLF